MLLYRVLPWLASAAEREPGHTLYVPEPSGSGRADNAGRYRALYLSDAAVGAVAEAFGNLKLWTPGMFERPDLPGSVRALATYELASDVQIFDLDDADSLKALRLRPSDVVTRDRAVTQGWALAVFERGTWSGVRWWSCYDPRWHSYAIWDVRRLTPATGSPRALTLDDPAVIEAAEVLRRPSRPSGL